MLQIYVDPAGPTGRSTNLAVSKTSTNLAVSKTSTKQASQANKQKKGNITKKKIRIITLKQYYLLK